MSAKFYLLTTMGGLLLKAALLRCLIALKQAETRLRLWWKYLKWAWRKRRRPPLKTIPKE